MNNGRIEIFTDLIPTGSVEYDKKIIPIILDKALPLHEQNVRDMDILTDYYYNNTDINKKTKTQQPTINSKIAIPYANLAVTTINSYCFSNPFTRSSRNSESSITEKIKLLNDALDDDDYDAKTVQTEFKSAICGVGYKFIEPSSLEEQQKGIYFHTIGDLDPRKTFIVKSNTVKKDKILACTFYVKEVYDEETKAVLKETVYNVYTKYHHWIFVKGEKDDAGVYTVQQQKYDSTMIDAYPLIYKKIPIVEYPRKQDRTGDFEIAKELIDAINDLASSRLDDIRQAVDYIITLRDIACYTDEEVEEITHAIEKGILAFRSIQGATVQPEIKVLTTSLNQSEVQEYQDFLCGKCEEALNIPNRESRGSSGDTGQAVENRAGYKSLENIAGLISMCAKQAENETLDIILSICAKIPSCPFADLSVSDIEIKANRNKVENMSTSAATYSTLKAAEMNDEDACNFSGFVDPIGIANRNKRAKEEREAQTVTEPANNSVVGETTEE